MKPKYVIWRNSDVFRVDEYNISESGVLEYISGDSKYMPGERFYGLEIYENEADAIRRLLLISSNTKRRCEDRLADLDTEE